LGSLALERVTHLGLIVTNDDFLPENINISLKFSSPFDKDQETDAKHLKRWSSFPTIASQFPRFLHFSDAKAIHGVARTKPDPTDLQRGIRSVLISEAMVKARQWEWK